MPCWTCIWYTGCQIRISCYFHHCALIYCYMSWALIFGHWYIDIWVGHHIMNLLLWIYQNSCFIFSFCLLWQCNEFCVIFRKSESMQHWYHSCNWADIASNHLSCLCQHSKLIMRRVEIAIYDHFSHLVLNPLFSFFFSWEVGRCYCSPNKLSFSYMYKISDMVEMLITNFSLIIRMHHY